MLTAKDAVAAGMADGVRTMEQVLAKLGAVGASGPPARGARAEMSDDEWLAAQQEEALRKVEIVESAAGLSVQLAALNEGDPKPITREEQRAAEGLTDERDPEHVRRARALALERVRYS